MYFLDRFKIQTTQQMGWAGSKNGDLLRLAVSPEFDALITADQGIEYQQNLESLPIPVVVMIASRTRTQELQPLVHRVLNVVTGNMQKHVYRVTE